MSAHLPHTIDIKADGAPLNDEVLDKLMRMVAEDDLGQPATFVLHFHDIDLALTEGTALKVGTEIEILGVDRRGRRATIMLGEITSLETMLDQNMKVFIVRGYDRSHRLYRGRKTRTWLKMTDSDIVATVAAEAGLNANTQATAEQHDYVIQDNLTDMEFLRARAVRNGFRIAVDNRTLSFRSREASPLEAPEQTWAETLIAFRSRLTAVGQPNSVEVRGWDTKNKVALVGTASTVATPSTIGASQNGGQLAQSAFSSSAKVVVTNQPVRTQGEATTLAQAVLDDLGGDYLSAEGECLGEPAIRAGKLVKISGVGTRLSGKYFVTASRHEYAPRQGYTTTFTVNGRRPTSLLTALDGAAGQGGTRGVVVGVVTNLNDPDKLGRVKLKFPWLDEAQESDWARVVSAGGGSSRGLMNLPEVNDEVLVALEHGDISRPYVLGGLWNSKDQPPVAAATSADGKVLVRTIKTRQGHTITLQDNDASGDGLIQIKTSGGHQLTLTDNDKKIEIKSASHTVTLDDQGRAVKITSGGDVEISGPGGKLAITTQGVELSGTGGKLAIAPAGVQLAAQTNLNMQANANLKVQANAMLDIQTAAILSIQGTLVKIN